MRNSLKKVIVSLVSILTLNMSMIGVNANAEDNPNYVFAKSWSILSVPSEPYLPNQHNSFTCQIPAYSGGYQTYCSSIGGGSGRKVQVTSSIAEFGTKEITSTGYSSVYIYSTGGTVTFYFNGVSETGYIVANGSIGYHI